MSTLFYYQSYLIILVVKVKAIRYDGTVRARVEGESRPLRLQERLMNLKCKETSEGRE